MWAASYVYGLGQWASNSRPHQVLSLDGELRTRPSTSKSPALLPVTNEKAPYQGASQGSTMAMDLVTTPGSILHASQRRADAV